MEWAVVHVLVEVERDDHVVGLLAEHGRAFSVVLSWFWEPASIFLMQTIAVRVVLEDRSSLLGKGMSASLWLLDCSRIVTKSCLSRK
jgi:hypothetical protein